MSTEQSPPPEERVAEFLGWFSLGLGVPQVLAPGAVNRAIGVRDDRTTRFWQRVVGVRELAAAAGIFTSQPRPVEWLWARVAGDVKDLALLASAWANKREKPGRLALATGSVLAITVVDTATALAEQRNVDDRNEEGGPMGPKRAKAAITVRAGREELYDLWRHAEYYATFMPSVEGVEIVEERPNEVVGWRAANGAHGSVFFEDAPGNRGTEVRLTATLKALAPQQELKDDLRRFKQIVETGEVVRSDGSPDGPLPANLIRQRPAFPPEETPPPAERVPIGGRAS
jgi:uncharacterized membrane protein